MKRLCFALCVIVLTCGLWPGEKGTVILPGHTDPKQVAVDGERLYVTDGPSIYIYSLKDFRLIKKFGEKGEGPGRFNPGSAYGPGLTIDIRAGRLLVNSIGKLSIYSKTGQYKREMNSITGRRFKLLGNKFLGIGEVLDGGACFETVNIIGPELIKEKELLRMPSWSKKGLEDEEYRFLSTSPPGFQVIGDKIFCSGAANDFKIDVFDINGEKSFTIEREYERIRFTRQHSLKVYNWLKKDALTKDELEYFLQTTRLPGYFPAVRQIFADQRTLYVMTYLEKNGKTEFFLFSSSGTFIKRVFLPIHKRNAQVDTPFVNDNYPFTLAGEKCYQLVKNKEKKEYELHVVPVGPGVVAKDPAAGAKFEWVKRAGLAGYDHGNSITLDKDNNIYITGTFEKATEFEGALHLAAGKKARDIFIVKYDTAGKLKWFKQAGGEGFDEGHCITTDSKNNLYVTGFFQEAAKFDYTTLRSNGNRDVFIARYDNSGRLLWVRQAGGSGIDQGYSVFCDHRDNIIVTGSFRETAAFGDQKLTARGFSDIFIASYDPRGKLVWLKQAGGAGFDRGFAVTTDRAGNVYATGYFKDNAQFDKTMLTSHGNRDIFVAKYAPGGDLQWVVNAGGNYWDYGYALTTDIKNNLYVTGFFYENAFFENHTLKSVNQNDLFVAAYDTTKGKLLWVRQAGGSSYDRGKGIAADNKGNIYVAGHFKKDITFPGCSITAHGYYDSFVARYDDRGNFLWADHAGGKFYDEACSIALDKNNTIYITGGFCSFGVFGKVELAAYWDDIFVGKLVEKR